MKERLTAFITLGFIFSLFFYYKVINPIDNNLLQSNINNSNSTSDIIIDLENEINVNSLIDEQVTDDEIDNVGDCSLSINQTDSFDFSSAFKYYRECNGSDNTFTWNNNLYSTILLSEVDGKKHQTSISVDNNLVVDKEHLELQNRLLKNN